MVLVELFLVRIKGATKLHVQDIARDGIFGESGQELAFLLVIQRMQKELIVCRNVATIRCFTSLLHQGLHVLGVGDVTKTELCRAACSLHSASLAVFFLTACLERSPAKTVKP